MGETAGSMHDERANAMDAGADVIVSVDAASGASETKAPVPFVTARAVGEGAVTVCGGCDSQCAFRARVDAEGGVSAEMPVEGHPCRADRLCGRGRRRLALPFSNDERIEHPLRRRPDGSFEAIGWDEAYAQIAERMLAVRAAHGPSSLACTTGVSSYYAWYAERLMHALGSPNHYGVNGACEASRITGWQHTLGYSPESDLRNTDYIVYLGRSLLDSANALTGDLVAQARERGAGIVTVDPRRNSTVGKATEWLKIRPGYDLALLLGIAHVLIEEDLYDHDFVARHTTGFDEFARGMEPYTVAWTAQACDISEEAVLRVARGLGNARPRAVVDCGFHGGIGVAYVNGTQTARMIALVDALLGDYGQEGGNLNPPGRLRLGDLDPERFPTPPVPLAPKAGADRYPLVEPNEGLCTTIGESIELGEIHALLAYASNPAMGYGNAREWLRMLGKLDLLVAIDIRMSETARVADFVLPDVTFLECDRGVGVSGGGLYYRNQVLAPVHPDTRPGNRIIRELAEALGVGEYFTFTDDDLARARIAPYGADLDELKRTAFYNTGIDLGSRTGEPVITVLGGKIPFADDVWAEAGLGRVPCWQPPLVEPGPDEFRLIAGNNPFESHTSTRLLARHAGDPARECMAGVWMHTSRAAQMGIEDGDLVEVYSEMGSDRAVARVTEDIHPSTLFTSASPGGRSGKNAGKREAQDGALGVGPLDHTPLRCDRLTGAALTQENVVRVRKLER